MQSTEDILLSDLYWRLHRNATISSFLLFLSSNNLIYYKDFFDFGNFHGPTISIEKSLLSVVIFVWATYAILVFWFEGDKEQASKTLESRKDLKKQTEDIENVLQSIRSHLSIIQSRTHTDLARLSSTLNSLERHRIGDSPAAMDIKEKTAAISEDDFRHFESNLSRNEQYEILRRFKLAAIEAIYARMSVLLQLSRDELKVNIDDISRMTAGARSHLSEVESLLQRKKRAMHFEISRDKARVFLTGKYIPGLFYAFALLHFIGLYCAVAYSALDWLKLMKVY